LLPEPAESRSAGRLLWKGSDPPGRASTARDGASPADAQRLVDHLAWRGLTARAVKTAAEEPSIGATLLATADRAKATMLVLGGYGHSRWREFILGGVTRHVVENAEIPVLMTH
jgi:nucleotide-binding universal stress UspA family protein